MAYGKDPRGIDENSSFRQQNARVQASRPRGGGGSRPRFVNEFKPSLDYPDTIRIIRGSYEVEIPDERGQLSKIRLAYFPFIEHFHGTLKKGAVCSAGPLHAFKNMRQPCLGCDKFWEQREMGNKKGAMGKREMYALTVMHFAPYAKVEQIDRHTGQVRRSQTGEPYMEWVQVLPHERMKYQGREMREWNLMHWALGYGHMTSLTDYAKTTIGQSCRNCGGMNCIVPIALTCQNCGNALLEYESTTLTPKQIDQMIDNPVRCPHCGNEGFLNEVLNCSNCGQGARADIYDVNIQVKKVQPSDGSNNNMLNCQGHSAPGPIDPRFAEHAKPLDLPKIYAPDSLEVQAEKWGINISAQAQQMPQNVQPQQFRPYGQSGLVAPVPQQVQVAPQMPMQAPQPMVQQSLPMQPQMPAMPQQQYYQPQGGVIPPGYGMTDGFNPGGVKY